MAGRISEVEIKMSEEPDKFKEVMEEIFDSKIEIIQMIDTIDKKLEKLILARNFDKSEPKGLTVPQDFDPLQTPKGESKTKVKEQITEKIPLIPKKNVLNAKIIHETEKAYIVKREDGLVAVVAKSHLTKEYAKNDVRQNIQFKPDRAWALNKLSWEEERVVE